MNSKCILLLNLFTCIVFTEVEYDGFDPEEVIILEKKNVTEYISNIDQNLVTSLLKLVKDYFIVFIISLYIMTTIIGLVYNYFLLNRIKNSLEKCLIEEFPNYSRDRAITRSTFNSTRFSLYGRRNCKGLVTLILLIDNTNQTVTKT